MTSDKIPLDSFTLAKIEIVFALQGRKWDDSSLSLSLIIDWVIYRRRNKSQWFVVCVASHFSKTFLDLLSPCENARVTVTTQYTCTWLNTLSNTEMSTQCVCSDTADIYRVKNASYVNWFRSIALNFLLHWTNSPVIVFLSPPLHYSKYCDLVKNQLSDE